jgi:hypothetical protein
MSDESKFDSKVRFPGALEASIEAAFGGVLREGGVTLHQMDVLDDYGSPADMAAAESADPEVHWQELSEEKLESFNSLVFLDAKAFDSTSPHTCGSSGAAWLPGTRSRNFITCGSRSTEAPITARSTTRFLPTRKGGSSRRSFRGCASLANPTNPATPRNASEIIGTSTYDGQTAAPTSRSSAT